jgi:hypothetical protein
VGLSSLADKAEAVSAVISALGLAGSAITLWLTFVRRGTIKMSRPTQIYFGPDGPSLKGAPKIKLRTVIFATAKRGRFIEGMHACLSKNEVRQNFPIWVFGNEKLRLGSGLFIGENGDSSDHHFLLLKSASDFKFTAGRYRLEIFAKILGTDKQTRLFVQELSISDVQSRDLTEPRSGLYFDWGPDSGEYSAHVEQKDMTVDLSDLMELYSRSHRADDLPD